MNTSPHALVLCIIEYTSYTGDIALYDHVQHRRGRARGKRLSTRCPPVPDASLPCRLLPGTTAKRATAPPDGQGELTQGLPLKSNGYPAIQRDRRRLGAHTFRCSKAAEGSLFFSMAPEKQPSRKPKVSDEQLLRSLITSFSIEGIVLSLEEARDLLRKAKLSLGKQPG